MDVLLGPTFTLDVASSPPPSFDEDRPKSDTVPSYNFFAAESSESSSSIGTPDDSDDENDDVSLKKDQPEEKEQEIQSKLKGLDSLDSLEDSLPVKKGLSNHFIGKSKSFTDLSMVSTVKELEKQENPFNKRRRVLIASKWAKRTSFYASSNPKSMPLLPVDEDYEDDDDDYEVEKPKKVSPFCSSTEEKKKPQDEGLVRQNNRVPQSYADHLRLRLGSFKSRSLSLADLQEHDEADEDNED
ncbi:hypothetical protein RJT34_16549 [Clitoria ternatea]|uniref:Uncharacterized protein n=1 Tax=Clitoria ternatea TaxID=43366 RepID=A0AAN9PCY6_CLITE